MIDSPRRNSHVKWRPRTWWKGIVLSATPPHKARCIRREYSVTLRGCLLGPMSQLIKEVHLIVRWSPAGIVEIGTWKPIVR